MKIEIDLIERFILIQLIKREYNQNSSDILDDIFEELLNKLD